MACALSERIGPHPKLRFSELRFRFRASTLHLVVRTFLTFQLTPSGHYVSERLTKPYSGELPAFAALSQLANIARFPSHSIIFKPVDLLATPIAPTVTPLDIRQPWLLLPRISQFVTSLSRGYANRLNRTIGGRETSTLLDSQPCRLLRHPKPDFSLRCASLQRPVRKPSGMFLTVLARLLSGTNNRSSAIFETCTC